MTSFCTPIFLNEFLSRPILTSSSYHDYLKVSFKESIKLLTIRVSLFPPLDYDPPKM